MICSEANRCFEEIAEGEKQVQCLSKMDCMEVKDRRSKLVCQENGKSYCLVNDTKEFVIKLQVDGKMMVNEPESKCDNICIIRRPEKCIMIFVELKGKDFYKAVSQLKNTIDQMESALKHFQQVHARMVFRSKRTPDLKATPEVKSLITKLKKHGGSFKEGNLIMEEKVSGFL